MIPAPLIIEDGPCDEPLAESVRIFSAPQIADSFTPAGSTAVQRGVMIGEPNEAEEIDATAISIRSRLIDYGRRYAAARGLYRIFNAACFRFYRSNIGPPATTDSPFATSATLDYQPSNTYADGTWYLSVSYFDGVLDSGFLPLGPQGQTYLTLTLAGGVAKPAPPSPPFAIQLAPQGGGVIRVLAYYLPGADGVNAATAWAIGYTTDGTTPAGGGASPTATRTITAGLAILAYDLPAQPDGTTVKVLVQVSRGVVYSTPGAVLSAVVSRSGPSAALDLNSWVGQIPSEQ